MSEYIDFDAERACGIAQGVQGIVRSHATLTERTSDPIYRELISMSRQWWLRWHAIGLLEVAAVQDTGDLADALNAAVGDTEIEIIECGGRPGYDAFTEWAAQQDVGFKAPIYVRDNSLWSETPSEGS